MPANALLVPTIPDNALRLRILAWGTPLLFGVYLLGGPRWCGDLAIAGLLAAAAGHFSRGVCIAISIALFYACFPPLVWPCYGICFIPLFYLWRYEEGGPLAWWIGAVVIGFTTAWITTPFLGASVGQHGRWLQTSGCLLFGAQFVGIAASVRWTRRFNIYLAAPLVATAAAGCELVRCKLCDFPILLLALPAAGTPLAQWARPWTLFGVSWLLYLFNFVIIPDMTCSRWARWTPTGLCILLAGLVWCGGIVMANQITPDKLPFTALLVQPHTLSHVALNGEEASIDRMNVLYSLTRESLRRDGTVDLVIWPESACGRCSIAQTDNEGSIRSELVRFQRTVCSTWAMHGLVGAHAETPDGRLYNSAYLVSPHGHHSRHDKLKLILFAETLPAWLCGSAVGTQLLQFFQVRAPYVPGQFYEPLVLTLPGEKQIRLGVSICFEMHFPWLPQYAASNRVDAVIHLTDESWFAGFPDQPQHGTWACQYRAIETRTWQLVCANWSHSAVIDPLGRIQTMLGDARGVVNTAAWSKKWTIGPGATAAAPSSMEN